MKRFIVIVLALLGTAQAQTPLKQLYLFGGWIKTGTDSIAFVNSSGDTVITLDLSVTPTTNQALTIVDDGSGNLIAKFRAQIGADSLNTKGATVLDTVIAGDIIPLFKIPETMTPVEVAAFTDQGTVTFQLEQRAEATPNSSGSNLLSSSLVADSDQEETTSFALANLTKDYWLVLNASAVSATKPTIFGVTFKSRTVPTKTHSVTLIDTVKANDTIFFLKSEQAYTITEVSGFTDNGTATIDIEIRNETTPNTAGTDVLSSALVCDNDQQEGTIGSASVAADKWPVLIVNSVDGVTKPTLLCVTYRYTID